MGVGVDVRRKMMVAAAAGLILVVGAVLVFRDRPRSPVPPQEIRGSSAWAREHYGDPDARGFKKRNIVTIEFLGRTMFVHEKAARHFLRLERLFEARAPEYAAAVATGPLDDWSYQNRPVRGEVGGKSNHAFGLAIDVNALTNVLGTEGNMPVEVVRQWEIEGGDWGGDWSRPDPMHFQTHLTPAEIVDRYHADGTPREWYLQELVGGG
ncbi:MAG: M15 family metallopeptidase [Actinomycetota bacterium]